MSKPVKKALLLMNLGSPDSIAVKDVKKYLDEFLMDERVIDSPYILRALLVKGIIVPFRSPKTAHAYSTIWTKEGSPLVLLTKQLRAALQLQTDMPIEIAMRYGNPSPQKAFEDLKNKYPHLDEVVLLPLYPHYAMSSYETAVEYAKKIHTKGKYPFRLSIIPPYYNDADYINAMAENIKPYLSQPYDHILFSYHGIPERHIHKSDPTGSHCLQSPDCCEVDSPAHATCYRYQCFTTTQLVAAQLNIPKEKYSISFQSRLGRTPWLKPYTDFRLEEMPKEGIKNLLILCPAFVSDCLETLEEIAIRGKESFINAGGQSYTMIPCLNVSPAWIKTITGWINEIKESSKVFAPIS